jgi:nitroreductase
MASASLSTSQVIDTYQWRYAVKKFDNTRQIDSATWEAIEKSLVLTPSSFGLQPWKFIVIASPETKSKLPSISWNQTQPSDCSHMVIFAARKVIDAPYLDKFFQKVAATRNVTLDSLAGYRQVIEGFVKNTEGRHLAWSSNQAYIALGQLMATAAMLGIDACPMEGIVASEYDKLLGLSDSNYTTVVGCAVGYRAADDKYALAPKVRFDATDVLDHV